MPSIKNQIPAYIKIDILERMCEIFCRVLRDYYQKYLSKLEDYYCETGEFVDDGEVQVTIPDEDYNMDTEKVC